MVTESENVVLELSYTVQKSEFTRQDLTVTEEVAEIRTDDNLAIDNKKVSAARAKTAPRASMEWGFHPVCGRAYLHGIRAGALHQRRIYQRHSALDISAAEGTPVKAAADGQVVFADDLIVSGKTVIIDHGMWLFTTYCHMSALEVSAGDEIMAGGIIGKVGSTGYATGPHLHYAASIKSTRINPDMLKEQDLLDFLDLTE